MKVVTQLIRHFWSNGALSMEQADHLVRHGFVEPNQLDGFFGPEADRRPWERNDDDPLEVVAESLERRSIATRRAKPVARRPVLTLDGLCGLLNEEFDRRAELLPAVVALAKRCGFRGEWQGALVALRNVDNATFDRGVNALRRESRTKLIDLRNALSVEAFRVLAAERGHRGAAMNAFRAFLQSEELGQLGKYSWLLKADAVAVVGNIRQVHRRLMGTHP